MDDLALLATLHDVGKIAIPEEILSKPGPLSPKEWLILMIFTPYIATRESLLIVYSGLDV